MQQLTRRIVTLALGSPVAAGLCTAATTFSWAADLVPESLVQLTVSPYSSPYAFVVDKKQRTLSVWSVSGNKTEKVEEFPSDMGRKSGDKTSNGDFKTPEGIYFIQTRLEGRKQVPFELYGLRAFTTDYPNVFDRRLGKTGHGIWLHAIPDSESLERGSRGCVVVRNSSILALTKYVKLQQTALIIHDEVKYISREDQNKKRAEIKAALEDWRKNWETKNIEGYMNSYSPSFKSLGMDKEGWRDYKKELSQKYSDIKIELSEPAIYIFRDQIVARMLQRYQSSLHDDFGEKILHLQVERGSHKIVAESWSAQTHPHNLGARSPSPQISAASTSTDSLN